MNRASVRAGVLVVAGLLVGCGNKSATQNQSPPATSSTPAAAQTAPAGEAKRYQLKGKILAVKADMNALTIDGQDIPNYMSAMTMDYTVKSKDSLNGLKPGDEISADIVAPSSGQPYLENIVVTKKAG